MYVLNWPLFQLDFLKKTFWGSEKRVKNCSVSKVVSYRVVSSWVARRWVSSFSSSNGGSFPVLVSSGRIFLCDYPVDPYSPVPQILNWLWRFYTRPENRRIPIFGKLIQDFNFICYVWNISGLQSLGADPDDAQHDIIVLLILSPFQQQQQEKIWFWAAFNAAFSTPLSSADHNKIMMSLHV